MGLPQNPLRTGNFTPARVLNIAHRGARAYAPENTLAAFRKAREFGCDMFELDVHLSKDGEIVAHHDDDLLRCTDVRQKYPGRDSYFISDFTYDEISRLDAGSWYVEQLQLPAMQRQPFLRTLQDTEMAQYITPEDLRVYVSGKINVPTLQQALHAASGMMVNIEIKTIPRMYEGITQKVVRLVETMGMENNVLISSFDHAQLVEARRLNKAIATAVLTSDRLALPGDYLQLLDADAYHPGCYGEYDSMGFGGVSGRLDASSVQHARASGRGVNIWTCNDERQMQELVDAGVTGIMSDYPNRPARQNPAIRLTAPVA
jgi:glycerophosphoryl diester phosphodiesterase